MANLIINEIKQNPVLKVATDFMNVTKVFSKVLENAKFTIIGPDWKTKIMYYKQTTEQFTVYLQGKESKHKRTRVSMSKPLFSQSGQPARSTLKSSARLT